MEATKFDEARAKKIIEKYSLSPKTLNTWRHRGKIPRQYANEDFVLIKEDKSKAQILKEERLINILSSEKINKTVLQEMTGIKHPKIYDVIKHKSTFYNFETEKITNELKKARIEIKENLQNEKYKLALNHALFEIKKVLQTDYEEYRKIINIKNKREEDFTPEQKMLIKDKYYILILELGKL